MHPRDDSRLKHPKIKMKDKEGQIGRENVSRLMRAEFDFDPKKSIKQNTDFDTTKINEEIIMDKIIEALGDKRNDEFYIEHPVCSKYFTLKREDGRSKITAKSKKYIY